MDNTTLSKYSVSFGISLALCAVLNALLVVAKEKSKSVADTMQKITGHHWVTHVAIVLVAFLIFGWVFARTKNGQGPKINSNRLTAIVVTGVLAGVIIILGFYAIAD